MDKIIDLIIWLKWSPSHAARIDADALGAVVGLVDADQAVRQLEHVGPE